MGPREATRACTARSKICPSARGVDSRCGCDGCGRLAVGVGCKVWTPKWRYQIGCRFLGGEVVACLFTVCSIAGAAHRCGVDAGRRGVERSGFARFAPLRIGAMPVLVRGFAEFAEFARGNGEMRVFIGVPPIRRLPWPWGGHRSSASRAPTGCVRRCGRQRRCGWRWGHCDRYR